MQSTFWGTKSLRKWRRTWVLGSRDSRSLSPILYVLILCWYLTKNEHLPSLMLVTSLKKYHRHVFTDAGLFGVCRKPGTQNVSTGWQSDIFHWILCWSKICKTRKKFYYIVLHGRLRKLGKDVDIFLYTYIFPERSLTAHQIFSIFESFVSLGSL